MSEPKPLPAWLETLALEYTPIDVVKLRAAWQAQEGGWQLTVLAIAGLVNEYHNDGTTRTAAETLTAIADVLGPPMEAVDLIVPLAQEGGWFPIATAEYQRWEKMLDYAAQHHASTAADVLSFLRAELRGAHPAAAEP